MIVNFEDYTQPLTEEEKSLIKKILHAFLPDPEIPITNDAIADFMLEYHGIRLLHPRIQKILSTIRKMEIQWSGRIMIGTGSGYHWTRDQDQIDNYIKSLEQRLDSTNALVEAAIGFRTKLECNPQYGIEQD
jgi:hypothetical protein